MDVLELRRKPELYSLITIEMATSKAMFVQRHQESYIVGRDILDFSTNLGRSIGTPLEVRRETQGPFPVATRI